MTTNITTKAAFARMCGVSKPAIDKAVASGRVVLIDKKVNLDHHDTQEYYFGKTNKQLNPEEHAKKPKVVKPPVVKKKQPVKRPAKKAKPKPPPPEPEEKITIEEELLDIPDDHEPDNGYQLPAGIARFEDITIHNLHLIPEALIKKIKEFETAAKAKQARLVSRGKLVERKVVKQVFAKIHTTDSNQWKTLEDKLVPILCGIFDAQDGGPESIKARKTIRDS
jgi:hypothetical protein